ncbi:PREDICTED: uncharacterized protein LOC104611729 isoform X2 [Nelumbo nucifera]|uniref:Uncharacterized protein LOC104611729 isoform X2 n=1 Tax=Nelumbo nucifera TaxID=4432 RepID=A0A1U8QC23_NELNU|nr:PREDICTED: uncharacterized protein LOC104611729 isoform X2 [Nelumbo nucifera]
MASRSLMENSQVSSKLHEEKLMKEISELRELRTAIMVEKCLSKNEVITCPKPMRRQMLCVEEVDMKASAELSDIIFSKASPPVYSVSPPVRASNPLIQDARFREQRISPSPIRIEGFCTAVDRAQRRQSILTVA